MNTVSIANLGPGFSDVAIGSQAVFKAVLGALSEPGKPVAIRSDAAPPAPAHPAAAAILLALLDDDTRLWLSAHLRDSEAAHWLRFHTGCHFTSDPGMADFAWINHLDDLPELDTFSQGTQNYPDQSTTCIYELADLSEAHLDPLPAGVETLPALRLEGPGLKKPRTLSIPGLDKRAAEQLEKQWSANHARFPGGVDLLIVTSQAVFGLPRTTRIQREV